MGLFDQFPYTNFHELNLDWILKALKDLEHTIDQFVAINALKYADPIQWDITRQYEKNTIVIDPLTGTAYISVQPVPKGVALTREEYWTVVFDLGSFVTRAAKNFTNRWESEWTLTATFPSAVGDWLVWNDTLFRVISNIVAGDMYVVDSNIRHFTIEEYGGHLEDLQTTAKDSLVAAINEVLQTLADTVGDLEDLNTTDKSNVVAAINEVLQTLADTVGDLEDLNTTDKSNVVSAINEVLQTINDLPAGDWVNVKKPPLPYIAAKGDGITDDTAAIQALLDNFGGVFFPSGRYRITDSLNFENKTLIGENCMSTVILGDITDKRTPIIKAGRTCKIEGLLIRFSTNLADYAPIYSGDFIGLYLAGGPNNWSLQRGSIVQNCRFDNVGGGIYDDNNGAFSGTYSAIEITNFYGYAFQSTAINTGNIYQNIYISNIDAPTRQVIGAFGLYGINNAGVIEQLNIEHVQTTVPVVFTNCTDLFVAGLHFEGCAVTNNYSGFIELGRSNIIFESVEFYYTRILQDKVTCLFHFSNAGNPYTTLPHSDVSKVVIKNLVCVGLNMPDPTIFPDIPASEKTLNTVSLYFLFRDGYGNDNYIVDLENYTWATTSTAIGNDDSQKYIDFQIWNPSNFTLEKLGQLPTYGATADRPTKRLCPYHTKYFDTDLNATVFWNGSNWLPVIPIYDGTMPTLATNDRPAAPDNGYFYYDTDKDKIIPYYSGSYREGINIPVLATADRPTNPATGYMYFDTNLRMIQVWRGSYYTDCKLTVAWDGPTTSRPSDVPNGFLYYDTTLSTLIIKLGNNWLKCSDGTVV